MPSTSPRKRRPSLASPAAWNHRGRRRRIDLRRIHLRDGRSLSHPPGTQALLPASPVFYAQAARPGGTCPEALVFRPYSRFLMRAFPATQWRKHVALGVIPVLAQERSTSSLLTRQKRSRIEEGQGQVLNFNFAVVWHASDELTNHLSLLGPRPKLLKSRAATSQE